MLRLAAITLLLLSFATPVRASEPEPSHAGRLSYSVAGGFAKSPELYRGPQNGYLGAQASIGLDLSRVVTAEAGVGYFALGSKSLRFVSRSGTGWDFYESNLAITPLTLGLTFRIPVTAGLRPFMSAGAGAYQLRMSEVPGYPTTRFGYHGGLGLLIGSGRSAARIDVRSHKRPGRQAEPGLSVLTATVGVELW